ncbi:copper transport protein ctr1 [Chytriomyces hyalinus]|nr:copper transport protein ctr1 [Chytriomyces hyalinus]
MATILQFASNGDLASIDSLSVEAEEPGTRLAGIRDWQDNNALHMASRYGHVAVVDWTLSHGFDVNERNIVGDTALIVATLHGHADVVIRLLQDPKCTVNAANDHGNTALHYACFKRHKPILHALLHHSPPPNSTQERLQLYVRNKYGKVPLDRTSLEIRKMVAAFEFMKGNGVVREMGVDAQVRSSTEILDALESIKKRYLKSVEPEIEIPFGALNAGRPFQTKLQNQYMLGTWYMSPVVVCRPLNQAIHHSDCRVLKAEVEALKCLHHPNIAAVLGVCLVTPNVSIVSDYVGSKSLFDLLRDVNVEMDVDQVMQHAMDVCRALKYMHLQSPPIYHLQLTSKSILISDNGTLKLTGYGHKESIFRTWSLFLESKTIKPCEEETRNMASLIEEIGIEYLAPELFSNHHRKLETINCAAVDVYAFGVLFLEIVTRDSVYPGLSDKEVYDMVSQDAHSGPVIAEYIPEELVGLLRACLSKDALSRCSITDAESQCQDISF